MRYRRLGFLTCAWLIVATACAHPKYPTPTLRPKITPSAPPIAEVTASVEATDSATAVVTADVIVEPATETATAVPVGTDSATEAATEASAGDPAEGERLFHAFQPAAGIACMTCHRTDSDDRLVGPGLKSVAIRARTRVPGQSVSQYLHTAIVDPSAYVVESYPDLMPKNWGKVFTPAQLDDLVAYLMSLSR